MENPLKLKRVHHVEFFAGDQLHAEQETLHMIAQFTFHPGAHAAKGFGRAAGDAGHIVEQSFITQHACNLGHANRESPDSTAILRSI